MKSKIRYQKRLGQFVLAGLMTGLSTYASANDFSLTNNQFSIFSDGQVAANVTTTLSSNGILVTSNNEIPQITVSSGNFGIPNFTFNLSINGTQSPVPRTHTFRVGLSITDNDNPDNRRFEAFIATLNLNVDSAGGVTGTIPNQDMSVAAKVTTSTGTITAGDITITNSSTNGPVSISGGTLTFNGDEAVQRLRARENTALNTILDSFALNGAFTFRVVVEEVNPGATAARVGVTSGSNSSTFTAVPRVATTCPANSTSVLSTVFKLLPNTGGFTNAYAIQGQFRAGSGGTAKTLDPFTVTCITAPPTTPTAPTPPTAPPTTPTTPVVDNATVNATGTAANALNTAISSGTTVLAQAALGNVLTSLTTLTTSVGTGATLSAAQQTQLQSNVEAVFSNIGNLITNVANDQAALTGVVSQLKDILTTLSSAGVPATPTLVNGVVSAGQLSAQSEARRGLAANATVTEVQTRLSGNQRRLEETIAASLPIPRLSIVTPTPVPGAVFTQNPNSSLEGFAVAACSGADLFGGTFGPRPACLPTSSALISDGRTMSIAALSTADIKIGSDIVSGITTIELPGESYAGLITAIRAVPEEIPNGIRIQRNGTAMLVGNGFAFEIAPAPLNVTGFVTAVADAGYTNQSLSSVDTGFRIELGGGERFAGVFAYNNLTGQTLNTNCGAVTIVEPTIAPTAPAYGFGVNCANGVKQLIVPHVDNTSFFASLDAANMNYQADRNTGFIVIGTTGTFKPSFFVSPLTAADIAYHTANKDALGIALQAIDVNGDGVMDYKVIAPNGAQVLYGVK